MAEVKIADLSEAPKEGEARRIELVHPVTEYEYALALYFSKDRYYAITDACKLCGTSLAKGRVNGMFAYCVREEHPWNIKTGLCKFNRTLALPTYRVHVRDDGLYIEI